MRDFIWKATFELTHDIVGKDRYHGVLKPTRFATFIHWLCIK